MLFCDHPIVSSCTCHAPIAGRRGFLTGLAAGAGVLALGGNACAQSAPKASPAELRLEPALASTASKAAVGMVKRIDVHHHPVPPAYIEAIGGSLVGPLKSWTVERSLADMDQAGVGTAMLSIPAAGLWPADAAANRKTARGCNEYMAGLVQKYPGRFGMWATLPMSDVEGSLAELAYALDTLHADGIGLFTVYGDNWLGDPKFAPVFAELNRRGTVVYTHPTTGTCCGNLLPGIASAVIEYGTDTNRTIASLLFSGTARRTPNTKFIFSHAGGTMPTLIERHINLSKQPAMAKVTPDGVLPELAKFYYDVAQAANLEALGPLMRVVPGSQVVFGTDYPYRTSLEHVAGLVGCGFSRAQLIEIGRTNALNLVPRLR